MLPKDPVMRLSAVNMKLRDFYGNLDELCEDMGLEKQTLMEELKQAGYTYDEQKNQFR